MSVPIGLGIGRLRNSDLHIAALCGKQGTVNGFAQKICFPSDKSFLYAYSSSLAGNPIIEMLHGQIAFGSLVTVRDVPYPSTNQYQAEWPYGNAATTQRMG